jgi:hypothetical protein
MRFEVEILRSTVLDNALSIGLQVCLSTSLTASKVRNTTHVHMEGESIVFSL